MANEITVTGRLQVSKNGTTAQGSKSFNLDLAGSHFAANVQSVGTAAEALSLADLANLRYAYLYNASTATVTVTMAAALLVPGDVMVFHPSTSAVTLQATAASTDVETAITEA